MLSTDIPYFKNSAHYFNAIRHMDWPVWLDSGYPKQTRGRFCILSAGPSQKLYEAGGKFCLADHRDRMLGRYDSPWTAIAQTLAGLEPRNNPDGLPFVGGLIGYLGYELGEPESRRKVSTLGLPRMQMGLYQWAVIQDHKKRTATLVGLNLSKNEFETIKSLLFDAPQKKTVKFNLRGEFDTGTKSEYLRKLRVIKEYLISGDCYQVNISTRFSAPYCGDAFDAYVSLREALPSQYSGYFETDLLSILSFSPEILLESTGGRVTSKPIKGTAPRGQSTEDDEKHIVSLINSEKNRAENIMIVDLVRNDLGKVCEPFSIEVPKLLEIESYANVHHLVSTISGKLRSDKTNTDLLAACFPGGSITGAPKKRAMEIIEELEDTERDIYCGSLGYLSADGAMQMNIAIRTMLASRGKIYCWGGGGIVADSDPEDEYQEVLNKISILLSAAANL